MGWKYRRSNTIETKPLPQTAGSVVKSDISQSIGAANQDSSTDTPVPSKQTVSETPVKEFQTTKSVFQNVPFTSQAPSGEWSDPMFQDGCEEASMIMSMAWVRGSTLTPESAKAAIESITQFETTKFGTFMSDTSAEDTAQVMRDYYEYKNVTVVHDTSIDALKNFLIEGDLVMAPMNGQALGNSNFTQPGPLHHMLVIIGYDVQTHEFVTNDPGTRKGERYRYNENVLYQALRDYPTSNTEQPVTDNQKTIIVVKKNG